MTRKIYVLNLIEYFFSKSPCDAAKRYCSNPATIVDRIHSYEHVFWKTRTICALITAYLGASNGLSPVSIILVEAGLILQF